MPSNQGGNIDELKMNNSWPSSKFTMLAKAEAQNLSVIVKHYSL